MIDVLKTKRKSPNGGRDAPYLIVRDIMAANPENERDGNDLSADVALYTLEI